MHQNQRARLVLGPFTLVLVLLAAGLIAGIGITRYHNRASSDSSAESVPSQNGIVLSSEKLDFGDLLVNRTAARHLLLRTTGTSPVNVRIEGTSAFSVDPDHLTIEPGRISRVIVTANPTVAGSFQDQLKIFADGGSKTPMVVALEGTARATHEMIAQGSVSVVPGTPGETESGAARYGSGAETSGADAPGVGGARDGAGAASGSVQITRSTTDGPEGAAGDLEAQARARQTPGMVVVPYDPSQAHRTISDRPNVPSADAPLREGEEPAPIEGSKKPADLDPTKKDDEPPPSAPTFVVSHTSTLTVLGSKNQFYPQQLGVTGSASGGSFNLSSSIQLPRLPIAFGQTMIFNPTGAPSGAFDASSGQVQLALDMEAVDPNGNAAPMRVVMSTGSVMKRNNSGVVIQLIGQPRSASSGVLKLVGIEKIPSGFRNAAEEQFVLVEIWASLTFPTPRSADASGGGN